MTNLLPEFEKTYEQLLAMEADIRSYFGEDKYMKARDSTGKLLMIDITVAKANLLPHLERMRRDASAHDFWADVVDRVVRGAEEKPEIMCRECNDEIAYIDNLGTWRHINLPASGEPGHEAKP